MIHALRFPISAFHQLETIGSKESCGLAALRTSLDQPSIVHLLLPRSSRATGDPSTRLVAAIDMNSPPNGNIQLSFKTHSAHSLQRFSPIHF
jgi:hypothetical protein